MWRPPALFASTRTWCRFFPHTAPSPVRGYSARASCHRVVRSRCTNQAASASVRPAAVHALELVTWGDRDRERIHYRPLGRSQANSRTTRCGLQGDQLVYRATPVGGPGEHVYHQLHNCGARNSRSHPPRRLARCVHSHPCGRRTRRDSAQLGIGFPDSTLTPVMDWPTPAAPPALPVQRQVPGLMPGHVPCYRQTNHERPVASAPHRRRTDVG